ncbi:hypothetical protein F0M18_17195 [Pseudohalioglobus sediminis]|uniref:Uncharacterized protein n=1 Tax=Pseudohalioglobus sediminis TaxID=2606449 RepID=A0A5B0WSW1_9GAMM|nr:hypothetical protein [Pseudohalioglobus sediminis]KAA1188939.1 hypothetical protein F0M18_17195 [Pseudohalioglobus sediminis]
MASQENSETKKRGRKSSAGEKPKLRNIPRNWLHQALFYMDRTEFLVRITVECLAFSILLLPISMLLQTMLFDRGTLILSFLLVHSTFWILNSNWWALMLFTFPGIRNSGERASCEYLSRMAVRLRATDSIAALAIYGSPTRGAWHDKSDLDLRILRKEGFVNGLIAAAITMRERAIAFLYGQPIDLFLADSPAFLKKMRGDEEPIILLKRGRTAANYFANDEVMIVDTWPEK